MKIYKTAAALTVLIVGHIAAASPLRDFSGNVYDSKSGELIYREQHIITGGPEQRQIRSVYTRSDGTVLAERTVHFSLDRVKKYTLQQRDPHYTESVTRGDNEIEIHAQRGSKEKTAKIKPDSVNEVVIDAGFSTYIERNWDDLRSGKVKKFKFVSTAQMDAVRLQVKEIDIEKSSAGEMDDVVMFNMTIANPVLRWLMEPIEVGYYQDTKQLAYYRGVSNLKDQQGKQYESVRIRFSRAMAGTASIRLN